MEAVEGDWSLGADPGRYIAEQHAAGIAHAVKRLREMAAAIETRRSQEAQVRADALTDAADTLEREAKEGGGG